MAWKPVNSMEQNHPAWGHAKHFEQLHDSYTGQPSQSYRHKDSGEIINLQNSNWHVSRKDGNKGSLGNGDDMYRYENLHHAMRDVHERATGSPSPMVSSAQRSLNPLPTNTSLPITHQHGKFTHSHPNADIFPGHTHPHAELEAEANKKPSADGVQMRAWAGDKDAQAEMDEYHKKRKEENRLLGKALKGYGASQSPITSTPLTNPPIPGLTAGGGVYKRGPGIGAYSDNFEHKPELNTPTVARTESYKHKFSSGEAFHNKDGSWSARHHNGEMSQHSTLADAMKAIHDHYKKSPNERNPLYDNSHPELRSEKERRQANYSDKDYAEDSGDFSHHFDKVPENPKKQPGLEVWQHKHSKGYVYKSSDTNPTHTAVHASGRRDLHPDLLHAMKSIHAQSPHMRTEKQREASRKNLEEARKAHRGKLSASFHTGAGMSPSAKLTGNQHWHGNVWHEHAGGDKMHKHNNVQGLYTGAMVYEAKHD